MRGVAPAPFFMRGFTPSPHHFLKKVDKNFLRGFFMVKPFVWFAYGAISFMIVGGSSGRSTPTVV